MSAKNNILIITNDSEVANTLRPKLILLREIDNISSIRYEEAIPVLKEELPDAVLVYCSKEKDDALALIKSIKADALTSSIEILLVVDEYEQEFVLSAYDEGITDYFVFNYDDAEVLMRTIWCLRKHVLSRTVQKQDKLLKQLNIVDKDSDLFSASGAEIVFNNEFNIMREMNSNGVLLYVKPVNGTLDKDIVANFVKKSTRTSDVVAHGDMNAFYVLLPNTSVDGAVCVWNKLKKTVNDRMNLCASACEVNDSSFKELKEDLLKAFANAEKADNGFYVINSDEKKISEGWLDKINSSQKNFKLFKQTFLKKLEKVVAPVFYQEQLRYEDKLVDTKIEQYSNEKLSAFILKNKDRQSTVRITYPGFSKINIDIIHEGLDTPENRRISLDLTELEEVKLIKIIDDFIEEFNSENL